MKQEASTARPQDGDGPGAAGVPHAAAADPAVADALNVIGTRSMVLLATLAAAGIVGVSALIHSQVGDASRLGEGSGGCAARSDVYLARLDRLVRGEVVPYLQGLAGREGTAVVVDGYGRAN